MRYDRQCTVERFMSEMDGPIRRYHFRHSHLLIYSCFMGASPAAHPPFELSSDDQLIVVSWKLSTGVLMLQSIQLSFAVSR